MPVSYNANNNKIKYIAPTLSSLCRAEYPTFVNHMIANAFSNTYTCLYLVLYSMSWNKRATHEYPSFYNPQASINYLQRII